MKVQIKSLRKASVLALLGCEVEVKAGRAYAPASSVIKAGFNFIAFKIKVAQLRKYWAVERRIDREAKCRSIIWDTYICTRFQCKDVLGKEWMINFWGRS